jgi:hypothetical protein
MADDKTTQTAPAPAAGTGAGQAAGQAAPATTGTSEPTWGQKFKSADDLWSAYGSLEKKLGEQGNELGQYRQAFEGTAREKAEYEKAVKAWADWYSKEIGGDAEMAEVKRFLSTRKGKQAAQQMAQATGAQTQATGDWTHDWETLSPQQQAQRLREISIQEIAGALTPALQNWQKQFVEQTNQQIAQKEAYFNNYLNLYRKVMDMRLQNPSLDVDAVLDQAVKVLGGQVDPIELGKQLATMSQDKESYAKAMLDQGRKDWDQEQKNKELAAVQPKAGGTPPVFKLANAGTTKGGLASLRESVAQKILEQHGPSVF